MKKKNSVPYPFVLDLLSRLDFRIKPMFGCHAIYVGEKIMIILRKKEDHEDCNGIWIATDKEFHKSLKKEFPSMKSISILSNGKSETNWQMIPYDDDNFESSATLLCEFILKKDLRVGRIPKARKKKSEK
ncbi:MAG: hypothetical protein IAF38_22015 [Bacteroidia bacterium]|nr:hypothetical protein [Bacteroidia bacterium]